jgi:hypothetical protein
MDVTFVAGNAEHGGIEDDNLLVVEHWWDGHRTAVSGGWVPYHDLVQAPVKEEDASMAAAHQLHVKIEDVWREEALMRDEIWRDEAGPEEGFPVVSHDEAEDWRVPVVVAEASEEPGIGDDAAPLLAYGGNAGQCRGLRGEEEENLPEEVVDFERRRWHSGLAAAAAAGHVVVGRLGVVCVPVVVWTVHWGGRPE